MRYESVSKLTLEPVNQKTGMGYIANNRQVQAVSDEI